MAQRLVNVITAFTLNLNRGGHLDQLRFAPGVQHIDEDVAEHWYAKAHFGPMPSPEDHPAVELHAQLQARADAVAAKEQELARRADQLAEIEAELRELETSLKEREAKVTAAEQSASSKKSGAK